MAFQGFSNDQAPEAFGAMVRRQGAGGNAMPQSFARPGGMQRPPDMTPPGPNNSLNWFNGPGQEMTKFGDRSYGRPQNGGIVPPGFGGFPQPDPAPRGGEGGNPWLEGPQTGGPNFQTPMGQMDPKHPMGPGWNRPPQPQMTRQMWQQNRLGQGHQLPVESPITPTEDWLGRSNGAPQGWNWSR